jgi:hypothetical protein
MSFSVVDPDVNLMRIYNTVCGSGSEHLCTVHFDCLFAVLCFGCDRKGPLSRMSLTLLLIPSPPVPVIQYTSHPQGEERRLEY